MAKLRFKGSSQPVVKRKFKTVQVGEEIEDVTEKWIRANNLKDIDGPVSLFCTERLLVFNESGEIETKTTSIDDFEPCDIGQVLVASFIQLGEMEFYTLKTAWKKFLSCDSKTGRIFATREAVGEQEKWQLIPVCNDEDEESAGHFALSCGKRFLSLEDGKIFGVEKDINQLEDQQIFQFTCQARKPLGKKNDSIQSKKEFKASESKESLLEKRIKTKHDPFC